jgi:predicted TIM-barrel fold metal-dependent hydrolase
MPLDGFMRGLFAVLLLFGGTAAIAAAAPPTLYDHHAHIWPPQIGALITKREKLDHVVRAFPASDLRNAMDSDHVTGVTILSTAYMYSKAGRNSPEMIRKMQALNDWTADQAKLLGDRAVVFCSFNPLADEAVAELNRCRRSGRFAGIKLHFANSKVDLRNPAHLKALKRVFRAIDAARFPIVIHMRTERKDYGRSDAEIFIRELLPLVHNVPVQIAHAAGWGGFDRCCVDGICRRLVPGRTSS